MAPRVAINGFGRVGWAALRSAYERELDIEFAAVNDVADAATLAHTTTNRPTRRGSWSSRKRVLVPTEAMTR